MTSWDWERATEQVTFVLIERFFLFETTATVKATEHRLAPTSPVYRANTFEHNSHYGLYAIDFVNEIE